MRETRGRPTTQVRLIASTQELGLSSPNPGSHIGTCGCSLLIGSSMTSRPPASRVTSFLAPHSSISPRRHLGRQDVEDTTHGLWIQSSGTEYISSSGSPRPSPRNGYVETGPSFGCSQSLQGSDLCRVRTGLGSFLKRPDGERTRTGTPSANGRGPEGCTEAQQTFTSSQRLTCIVYLSGITRFTTRIPKMSGSPARGTYSS